MSRTHPSRIVRLALPALATIVLFAGCSSGTGAMNRSRLAGAWRSQVTFQSGPLAGAPHPQFLYGFNPGGTMTESSNYDEAANSSPPAYGVWKTTGERKFLAKYVFFTTKAADSTTAMRTGSDWWPAGHGVLTEHIELSPDGRGFKSRIKLELFDLAGEPVGGAAEGSGEGSRIDF